MWPLIAGEARKVLTTRVWLWLLLAAAGLTILYAVLTMAFADTPDALTAPLTTAEGQRTLFAVGGAAAPFAALLGAIGLTAEYRHRTATITFLTVPHRGQIITAKLIVHVLAGAAYAVVCISITTAVVPPWLASQDISIAVPARDLFATDLGVVTSVALFAAIGVGLGALIREQVAAVVTLLIYLFVVENILTNITALHQWTPYLPGQAQEALIGSTLTNQSLLTPWQGGLVLTAYSLAIATIGTLLTAHRDVT